MICWTNELKAMGRRYIAFGSSDAIVEVVDSDLIGTQEEVEDSFCEQEVLFVMHYELSHGLLHVKNHRRRG